MALQWPLEYYATIGTVLAVAFDIFVVLCVAFAPTILRHRVMCAICMLLVPIYSEVYSLPLYVFWFASFLPVLALIWLPDRTGVADRWFQLAFVVAGGLSSPFIIALFPLFLVRAFVVRRRSELLLLIAAATTVGAQMWNAFPANARIRADSVADLVELTLSKFFGYYLLSPAGRLPALALGCILFAYVGEANR